MACCNFGLIDFDCTVSFDLGDSVVDMVAADCSGG